MSSETEGKCTTGTLGEEGWTSGLDTPLRRLGCVFSSQVCYCALGPAYPHPLPCIHTHCCVDELAWVPEAISPGTHCLG